MLVTSVLPFVATKPQSDTQLFIVVNQNELEMYGEIWVEAEANVTWQLDVDATTTRNATTARNQPMHDTLASSGILLVEVTLSSAGLNADAHSIVIGVWAKTAESLRVEERQSTTFTVTSDAVANRAAMDW